MRYPGLGLLKDACKEDAGPLAGDDHRDMIPKALRQGLAARLAHEGVVQDMAGTSNLADDEPAPQNDLVCLATLVEANSAVLAKLSVALGRVEAVAEHLTGSTLLQGSSQVAKAHDRTLGQRLWDQHTDFLVLAQHAEHIASRLERVI